MEMLLHTLTHILEEQCWAKVYKTTRVGTKVELYSQKKGDFGGSAPL